MVDGWEWDETLFSGSAPCYRRGRLPYAPGLAEALTEALALDGRGRLQGALHRARAWRPAVVRIE
jgi:hypothetical protein